MMLTQAFPAAGTPAPRDRDRRTAPRHLPAYDRLRLAWMEGKGLRRIEARLRDLSSGGALIATHTPITAHGPIWIGLEGTPLDQWVLAEVVRVVPAEGSGWRAGLMFIGRCPHLFYRRALWGFVPGKAEAPGLAACPSDGPISRSPSPL